MLHLYLGTFLSALATLALEVALTRLLSLTTWYHLAFFALSTAMLGMTAGAVRVYLRPDRFAPERWAREAASACVGFALATPCAVVLLSLIATGVTLTTMGVLSLLTTTVVCAVPFYFFGIAITLALTRSGLPIGRIYGADLTGASAGCLFVLAGLEHKSAPSVILWCAALGALAAVCFGWRRSAAFRVLALLVAVGLGVAGAANTYGRYGLYPVIRKAVVEFPSSVLESSWGVFHLVELEKWNALARVSVSPEQMAPPRLWGPSPKLPPQLLAQRELHIDGGASTTLRRFASRDDLAHQRYDVVNVAYHLRPKGGAAIIGVGGGKDTQSAIWFGHERITAIDVNPSIIGLLTNEFRQFVGIADHPGVTLVCDDARSCLTHSSERYAVIQMSLIDSWASTQAGAFTLSENALYTTEAWQVFLARLSEGGVFTVSRFFDPNDLGECGRLLSLGVAALLGTGAAEPARQLALITSGFTGTLLLSNRPFGDADLAQLRSVCQELQFNVAALPGTPCPLADLQEIIAARSMDELLAVTSKKSLNYDPPTDENPYFFNLLRLGHLDQGFAQTRGGVLSGNIMATFVLMGLMASLLVIAVATIVLPLLLRRRLAEQPPVRVLALLSGAVYFSAIGAGFMFTQVALIQRLSVFLGHPTYALGVLLFAMIASAGCGSLLSERLPASRIWLVLPALVMTGLLCVLNDAVVLAFRQMMASALSARIAVSVALVAPVGLLLGTFFPAGMRLASRAGAADTPWFWALNGVFGVLGSACAVFVSLYLGISANFQIAAACYASLVISAMGLALAGRRAAEPAAEPAAEAQLE